MALPFSPEALFLNTETARRLYHDVAADLPVVDFHNHLSAADLAADRRYASLTELWLDGDHYKWRAMRANGIAERYVTGEASPEERFRVWAETVPYTLRNPLFHWTHLELRRAFGIETLLSPQTADAVYAEVNARLAEPGSSVRGLVRRSGAEVLCTTDDPADTLEHHERIAADGAADRFSVTVLPTFRADGATTINDPGVFNAWADRLGDRTNLDIDSFDVLLDALDRRHAAFHAVGCRLADHGLATFPDAPVSDIAAASAFARLRAGQPLGADQAEIYRATVCHHLAVMHHARGWAQQFHVGPQRNTNSRLAAGLGADAGCDSIGDGQHGPAMARFFDRLDRDGVLARTVIYNSNPADNAVFATMAGNFNDGSVPNKVQLGAPWWFLDQKKGLEDHLNDVSMYGLLSRFAGMVTDSRSVLSLFSRHDYFRRVLCNLLGGDVERGELPSDLDWIGSVVRAVCHGNPRALLGLGVTAVSAMNEPVSLNREPAPFHA